MSFLSPWALVALASIGVIIFLHKFVFKGTQKQVSHLFLWAESEANKQEGSVRKKVASWLVMSLEILAATFLCFLIAGIAFTEKQPFPHMGIIIDNSASMGSQSNRNSPLSEIKQHLDLVFTDHPGLRLTIILSGNSPQILGEQALTQEQLSRYWPTIRPQQSGHSLKPSLDLLAKLHLTPQQTLIFSDNPELAHPRLVRVGEPQPNVGFIGGNWEPFQQPFAHVKKFDLHTIQDSVALRLVTNNDESQTQYLKLEFEGKDDFLLSIPFDEETERLDLYLDDDGLPTDNHLTLFRPKSMPLVFHANAKHKKLLNALGKMEQSLKGRLIWNQIQGDFQIVQSDTLTSPEATPQLTFFSPNGQTSQMVNEFSRNSFSKLMEGVDFNGLLWYAYSFLDNPSSSPKTVLLESDNIPLIWQQGKQVVFNIDLEKSNWFQHPSFPIFFWNYAHSIRLTKDGLARWNFRQGEMLSLLRKASANQPMVLHGPRDGEKETFTTQTVHLGPLKPGIYMIEEGEAFEKFSVNFLDSGESDLTQRNNPSDLPTFVTNSVKDSPDKRTSQILLVLTLLALISAWILLLRQKR